MVVVHLKRLAVTSRPQSAPHELFCTFTKYTTFTSYIVIGLLKQIQRLLRRVYHTGELDYNGISPDIAFSQTYFKKFVVAVMGLDHVLCFSRSFTE